MDKLAMTNEAGLEAIEGALHRYHRCGKIDEWRNKNKHDYAGHAEDNFRFKQRFFIEILAKDSVTGYLVTIALDKAHYDLYPALH